MIKKQIYIKNSKAWNSCFALSIIGIIFPLFHPAILNSHSLFNHSRNVTLTGAFKHVELRRKQCQRMRVVILHVAPCCLCLTLASCGRCDRTGVAPEVVAPRHGNAWNVREVGDPHILTNELAIPPAGCKILMTLLWACQESVSHKSDGVIRGKWRNGGFLYAALINQNRSNYIVRSRLFLVKSRMPSDATRKCKLRLWNYPRSRYLIIFRRLAAEKTIFNCWLLFNSSINRWLFLSGSFNCAAHFNYRRRLTH